MGTASRSGMNSRRASWRCALGDASGAACRTIPSSLPTRPLDECRVWLDLDAGIYAIVSPEDHAWALQWRWQITWDRHKRKAYATRSTRLAGNRRVKIYLHKAILNRSGKVQPCEKHTMGDHGDGDSLNCKRENLEWTTPSKNRQTARPVRRAPKVVEDIPF